MKRFAFKRRTVIEQVIFIQADNPRSAKVLADSQVVHEAGDREVVSETVKRAAEFDEEIAA